VFIITDRGTGQRYVIPEKAADESTIRLLLADRTQEPITVYIDGFRVYEPFEEETHSTANTLSAVWVNTLMTRGISTPAGATYR
jgi:transposase-like protein